MVSKSNDISVPDNCRLLFCLSSWNTWTATKQKWQTSDLLVYCRFRSFTLFEAIPTTVFDGKEFNKETIGTTWILHLMFLLLLLLLSGHNSYNVLSSLHDNIWIWLWGSCCCWNWFRKMCSHPCIAVWREKFTCDTDIQCNWEKKLSTKRFSPSLSSFVFLAPS